MNNNNWIKTNYSSTANASAIKINKLNGAAVFDSSFGISLNQDLSDTNGWNSPKTTEYEYDFAGTFSSGGSIETNKGIIYDSNIYDKTLPLPSPTLGDYRVAINENGLSIGLNRSTNMAVYKKQTMSAYTEIVLPENSEINFQNCNIVINNNNVAIAFAINRIFYNTDAFNSPNNWQILKGSTIDNTLANGALSDYAFVINNNNIVIASSNSGEVFYNNNFKNNTSNWNRISLPLSLLNARLNFCINDNNTVIAFEPFPLMPPSAIIYSEDFINWANVPTTGLGNSESHVLRIDRVQINNDYVLVAGDHMVIKEFKFLENFGLWSKYLGTTSSTGGSGTGSSTGGTGGTGSSTGGTGSSTGGTGSSTGGTGSSTGGTGSSTGGSSTGGSSTGGSSTGGSSTGGNTTTGSTATGRINYRVSYNLTYTLEAGEAALDSHKTILASQLNTTKDLISGSHSPGSIIISGSAPNPNNLTNSQLTQILQNIQINDVGPDIVEVQNDIPCFLNITEILTISENQEDIYKPISCIRKGDFVKGAISGKPEKVIHCGYGEVSLDLLEKYNFPRRIPKDFFAPNRPTKDIYCSGGHSILALIANSKEYLRIPTKMIKSLDPYEITQEDVIKEITGEDRVLYYHIELENAQEGVIASGLSVESMEKGWWERCKFTENENKNL